MSGFFYSLAFRRSGKPRKWLSFLLFTDNMAARPMFRRIVHKKNGRVRPHFAYWVNNGAKKGEDALGVTSKLPQRLLPQELVLQALLPFEASVKGWRGKVGRLDLLAADAIADLLGFGQTVGQPKLVISVGHDDYIKVPGGIQLCIQREQALAAAQGIRYLQIHPLHPLPRLAHVEEEPDTIINLILDGRAIGSCQSSALIHAVKHSSTTPGDIRVVVHHLLGHLPEQVTELVNATGAARCVFWLHDFFAICPSYNLQRNKLVFCGAPPVNSNACMLCVFGSERAAHLKRIDAFFASVVVDVASPSVVTAEFWQARSDLKPATTKVLPHMMLDIVPRLSPAADRGPRPITVGFLGAPSVHKGWWAFADLLQQHGGSGEYRFVVMSNKEPHLGEQAWVKVHVTADMPTAMSDAVAAEDVDIVLHWPTWPETFSFTTFEALAGSAYVVTNTGSGNVAAAVEQFGRGAVLSDDADLFAFFRDGRAVALAADRRVAKCGFEVLQRHSDMSFPLIWKD